MNFRKLTTAIAAVAILMSFASIANAASRHQQSPRGFNAYGSAPFADSIPGEAGGVRARALQDCNNAVAGKRDYTWGVQVGDQYRACMTEHGQPE
jgi:hypothetical protein